MRQTGQDMSADALDAKVRVAAAACNLGPDSLHKLSVQALKDNSKVVVSNGHTLTVAVWCRLFFAVGCETLEVSKHDQFVNMIQPWKAEGLSHSVDTPLLWHIGQACETEQDGNLVCSTLLDTFFSDPLSRKFKSPQVNDVQDLAKKVVANFGEVDNTPVLDTSLETCVEAWDYVMTASRGILALSDPRPSSTGYADVRSIFSPEAKLPYKQLDAFKTSVMSQKLWMGFLTFFWADAANDSEVAEHYDKLYEQIRTGPMTVAILKDMTSKVPEWRKSLRTGATRAIEDAFVQYMETGGQQYINQDLDDAQLESYRDFSTAVLAAVRTLELKARVPGIAEFENLLKAVNCLDNSNKVKTLATEWAGNIDQLSEILACLDAVHGHDLEAEVLESLADLRGFILKAVVGATKAKSIGNNSAELAILTLRTIADLPGMAKVSPVEGQETDVLVGLIEKGFACLQPLNCLIGPDGKGQDLPTIEVMLLLGKLRTAQAEFEKLPIVAGGPGSPSLVNTFHAKAFIDSINTKLESSKSVVDSILAGCGSQLLEAPRFILCHFAVCSFSSVRSFQLPQYTTCFLCLFALLLVLRFSPHTFGKCEGTDPVIEGLRKALGAGTFSGSPVNQESPCFETSLHPSEDSPLQSSRGRSPHQSPNNFSQVCQNLRVKFGFVCF
jgi:hypothetical protein